MLHAQPAMSHSAAAGLFSRNIPNTSSPFLRSNRSSKYRRNELADILVRRWMTCLRCVLYALSFTKAQKITKKLYKVFQQKMRRWEITGIFLFILPQSCAAFYAFAVINDDHVIIKRKSEVLSVAAADV
jgi:hypothetical protein